MRKIITTVACCILVSISSTAPRAQTQDASKQEESFKQADEALNAAFKRLLAKISPDGQAALRKAETTWVSFRDQECEFEALGSKGGSVSFVGNLGLQGARDTDANRRTTCSGELPGGGRGLRAPVSGYFRIIPSAAERIELTRS